MTEGSGTTPTAARPEPAAPGSTHRPAPLPPSAWQRTFSALRHRNYRLWFLGQLVSLVGTWMQITAQSFLVFQLTHSTAYLGFVGFANGLPSWLFMLYGGVVADRVARRTLLLLTQSTMLLLAAVLAGLAFTGVVQPWHVVLLAFALGTANAFDAPVAQLREGVRYTLAHPILRSLIAIQAGTALFGMAYATLLPAWAVAVLGGNATTNGLLQSARGAGSLLGALMIAALAHHGRRGRWLTLGTFLFPAVVLIFAAVRTVPLALAVLVGVGWSSILLFNAANTLVQAHVADALRGRVMAIFSLTFFGGMPLCALWAGPLADGIGAPATLGVSGGLLLGLAVVYWVWAPQVRRLACGGLGH